MNPEEKLENSFNRVKKDMDSVRNGVRATLGFFGVAIIMVVALVGAHVLL